MSDPTRPQQITVYPPQSEPLVYSGEEVLGVAVDPTIGVFVRVRDKEGREVAFFGLPFSMVKDESRIAHPPRGSSLLKL